MNYPPRVPLAHLPTPIEKLERLSRQLGGPTIYVKRDDQTGLATGGNKARKLEFLFADALARNCDHVVTLGGPQSNHVRQTAAAAAKLGVACCAEIRRRSALGICCSTNCSARRSTGRARARVMRLPPR